MRKFMASVAASALLTVGVAGTASAQPVVTGGLVNVTITNLLTGAEILSRNDVRVGAALNLAANVCDVNVNVLAEQLETGDATCDNGNQEVTISQNN